MVAGACQKLGVAMVIASTSGSSRMRRKSVTCCERVFLLASRRSPLAAAARRLPVDIADVGDLAIGHIEVTIDMSPAPAEPHNRRAKTFVRALGLPEQKIRPDVRRHSGCYCDPGCFEKLPPGASEGGEEG